MNHWCRQATVAYPDYPFHDRAEEEIRAKEKENVYTGFRPIMGREQLLSTTTPLRVRGGGKRLIGR